MHINFNSHSRLHSQRNFDMFPRQAVIGCGGLYLRFELHDCDRGVIEELEVRDSRLVAFIVV
jgi:hypothetical protein